MITADPNSELYKWCRIVADMKPGECLDVDWHDMVDIASYVHNEAKFTAPDRILGNIVGSAYTHSYQVKFDGLGVTFIRHANTGERRHKDPDHEYRVAMLSGQYGGSKKG